MSEMIKVLTKKFPYRVVTWNSRNLVRNIKLDNLLTVLPEAVDFVDHIFLLRLLVETYIIQI